jgi:uncharacterized protein (TIGR02996 family)
LRTDNQRRKNMNVIDAQDGRGLLDNIIANPDDDVPRLIYADWLEEFCNMQGRACFIRRQIQTYQIFHPKTGEISPLAVGNWPVALSAEEFWDWFGSYPEGWLRAWPGSPAVSIQCYSDGTQSCVVSYQQDGDDRAWEFTIERGFPKGVALPQRAWLDHGPGMVGMWPLTEVKLTDKEPSREPSRELGGTPRWHFYSNSIVGPWIAINSSLLDAPIWRAMLVTSANIASYQNDCIAFSSREKGMAALSLACLEYARKKGKGL